MLDRMLTTHGVQLGRTECGHPDGRRRQPRYVEDGREYTPITRQLQPRETRRVTA
jgi:hypothetical protein